MSKRLVSGEISFAGQVELPPGTAAYVRLLNTSMADAPARVIAEQVLRDIHSKANKGEAITFSLEGDIQGERDQYAVSVLVDVDGDGQISVGDFINMQSYPVITFGHPSHVVVEVKKIE